MIYSLCFDWLKAFSKNDRILYAKMEMEYVQHICFAQNGALTVRLWCIIHDRAIIMWIIYMLGRTIYGLGLFLQNSEFIFDYMTHF